MSRYFFEKFSKFFSKQGEIAKQSPTTRIIPFLGSELHCGKKEAMAYILQETVRKGNKRIEDKIKISEIKEIIDQLKKENNIPAIYQLFPLACWNALWEMGDDDNMIEIITQADSPRVWVKVVPGSILAKMIWTQ